jgi:septation ring formation regulator EzrA
MDDAELVKRLRDAYPATHDMRSTELGELTDEAAARIEALAAEKERCKRAYSVMNEDVCQTLGKVMGFPWFKDHQEHFPGATEEQGVAHDQVAETMAEIAAAQITKLASENAALREALAEITSHDLVAIQGAGRVVASKMQMRARAALEEAKP